MAFPSAKRRRWHRRAFWPALAALIAAFGTAVAAVVREVRGDHVDRLQLAFTIALGASAVFLGGLKTVQARAEDGEKDRLETPADVTGCLYVIHQIVVALKKATDVPDGWLRVAVYRVTTTELEQSVDYVGSADRGAGRLYPITSGLIGRVARTGAARVVDRKPSLPTCVRQLPGRSLV